MAMAATIPTLPGLDGVRFRLPAPLALWPVRPVDQAVRAASVASWTWPLENTTGPPP